MNSLLPRHTKRFCCAAALGARVHRFENIRDLRNSINLDTNPSLRIHLRPQRHCFLFLLRRSQMTDSRQHAKSKTLQAGPCARAVSSLYGGELLLS